MRYKNPSEVAGRYLYYEYTDEKGNKYGVKGDDTSAASFPDKVRQYMRNHNQAIPDDLASQIEDQVCGRLPKGMCWYEKKLGDGIAVVAHTVASLGDKAASVFGVKNAGLEKKARSCGGCNKRRAALNKVS